MLLVTRRKCGNNAEDLDVPLHVYLWRKEVVSVMDEVRNAIIGQSELNKWYVE